TVRRLTLFFFNDTAPTEIYTLSLHAALPISYICSESEHQLHTHTHTHTQRDRKSTRLNSSHTCISYAVFCLQKKTHTRSQNHALCLASTGLARLLALCAA